MFLDLQRHNESKGALRDQHGCFWTYGQLREEISQMQSAMPSRCLAFVLCENSAGSLLGYLAMVEAGIVPVMLSKELNEELLVKLCDIYRPALIWLPSCEVDSKVQALGIGFGQQNVLYERCGYLLLRTDNKAYPLNDLLSLCLSTSGSTGSPKLVRYTRDNLEANARNVALAFEWTPDERAFADLGMQYTMGLNVINTHLYAGAEVLLCDSNPMSGEYWDFLEKTKATNITGVPFSYEIFHRLLITRKDLPNLRTFAEGGGRLSDDRFEEFAQYARTSGKRFIATFGTTETAARMSYLPAGYACEKTGSIGMPIPGGEMYLLDAEGNRIDTLVAEGELVYKGPNVTMGYARCKEDLALGDVWQGTYRTGDLARRDANGFYYITGRLGRFVKLLGHRISLDECERLIQSALDIDCACVGDDSAIVVFCEDESQLDECTMVLQDKIGIRPSQCQVVHIDVIPRTESGKKKYAELHE